MLDNIDELFEDKERLTWEFIENIRLLEEYYEAVARLTNCPDKSL